MSARRFLDLATVIDWTLGDLAGLTAVDIGCGGGTATRALAAAGAQAMGVEPNAAAIAAARADGSGLRYIHADAAETGLQDSSADVVLFSMSLHHLPVPERGLLEALRILRPRGRIAVLEPQAPDPSWPAIRMVDDESAAYAEAQGAVESLVAAERVRRGAHLEYAAKYRFGSARAMVDEMLTIDPSRSFDEANLPRLEQLLAQIREEDGEGPYLTAWMRMDILIKSEPPVVGVQF